MKPTIFLTLLLVQLTSALAQPLPYHFSYRAENYQLLQNAQNIPLNNFMHSPAYSFALVPIGFSFQMDSIKSDSVFVILNRPVLAWTTPSYLGSGGATSIKLFNCRRSADTLPITEIRYITIGTAPNRTFKIEYHHLGFKGLSGDITVQGWLFEGSDSIQVRIGALDLPTSNLLFNNFLGPEIGFVFAYGAIFDSDWADYSHFAIGDPTNPKDTSFYHPETPVGFNSFVLGLNGVPDNGAVFTFYPQKTTGINSGKSNHSFSVFPNPANDILHLKGLDFEPDDMILRIFNQLGVLVKEETLPIDKDCFSCSGLAAGHYWVELLGKNRRLVSKFEKSN